MNLFKNPFNGAGSVEVILLRAYVLLEFAARLFVLAFEQLREVAQQVGLV